MEKPLFAQVAFPKLVVTDLEKQAAFYRSVCGYGEGKSVRGRIAGRRAQEIIFNLADGSTELILLAFPEGDAPTGAGGITAFDTPDIDAFEKRLLDAGGTIVEPITEFAYGDGRMRVAFYADPEGHIIEIIQR